MRPFCLLLLAILFTLPLAAQVARQRLILKDGTYQVVTRYEVKGDRVRYQSAERGGVWEELPADLIDWPATRKYEEEHKPGAHHTPTLDDQDAATTGSSGMAEAAAIDKQTAAERADQAARTPLIAPGLRLPDESGVWILDSFHDQPEAVELKQSSGDLNNEGHNVLRTALGGISGSKQLIQIEGGRSKVQLHVSEPAIFVSLDTDSDNAPLDSDSALTVDTKGAGSRKDKNQHSSPDSGYVIVRVEQRKNLRVVGAMKISLRGQLAHTEDVVETKTEILPGKHWMKITPKEPLPFGEYALMEVLSPNEVNLDVWDFGVNPREPENKNVRTPETQQP